MSTLFSEKTALCEKLFSKCFEGGDEEAYLRDVQATFDVLLDQVINWCNVACCLCPLIFKEFSVKKQGRTQIHVFFKHPETGAWIEDVQCSLLQVYVGSFLVKKINELKRRPDHETKMKQLISMLQRTSAVRNLLEMAVSTCSISQWNVKCPRCPFEGSQSEVNSHFALCFYSKEQKVIDELEVKQPVPSQDSTESTSVAEELMPVVAEEPASVAEVVTEESKSVAEVVTEESKSVAAEEEPAPVTEESTSVAAEEPTPNTEEADLEKEKMMVVDAEEETKEQEEKEMPTKNVALGKKKRTADVCLSDYEDDDEDEMVVSKRVRFSATEKMVKDLFPEAWQDRKNYYFFNKLTLGKQNYYHLKKGGILFDFNGLRKNQHVMEVGRYVNGKVVLHDLPKKWCNAETEDLLKRRITARSGHIAMPCDIRRSSSSSSAASSASSCASSSSSSLTRKEKDRLRRLRDKERREAKKIAAQKRFEKLREERQKQLQAAEEEEVEGLVEGEGEEEGEEEVQTQQPKKDRKLATRKMEQEQWNGVMESFLFDLRHHLRSGDILSDVTLRLHFLQFLFDGDHMEMARDECNRNNAVFLNRFRDANILHKVYVSSGAEELDGGEFAVRRSTLTKELELLISQDRF